MGFFTNSLKEVGTKRYTVKYIQGLTGIDNASTGCNIAAFKDGVNINIVFKKEQTIPWEKIVDIKAESEGEITEKVSMNTAAVGYLFFGPVGALLGARKQKKDERLFFLTLYIQDEEDVLHAVLFETKKAYEIFNELHEKWEKYCGANGISIAERRALLNIDADNELQKLIQQKAKGKISSAEFEAKKKMLSRE